MVVAEIVPGPIVPFANDDTRTQEGSQLVFNGRVRATEHGRPIVALEYEQYEGMAAEELRRTAGEAASRFPVSDVLVRHRVGRVEVGEVSVHVVVWSPHRREGLEALAWFVAELKKRVPIWKWAVLPDGTRIPSACDHAAG